MTDYVMPEDKFDYCESCGYLEEVVAVIWLDQLNVEVPLCNVCASEMEGNK